MKGNVLLVDDNLDVFDSTKDVLEDQGYQVDTSTNGEDALTQANNHSFDVILMDIKMPGMNGVESFIKMKEENAHTCLAKPLNIETLIKLLDEIIVAKKEGRYHKKGR